MTEILSIGTWRSNAEMIADVARLGYLDGVVLDATYGQGGFWTIWKPTALVTNDLYKPADHAYDYRAFPIPDHSGGDAVVLDPPYKLNTPALGEQDERYGTTGRTSRAEVLEDIRAGAVECYRVCVRHLLVKCMDQVEGGRMRWQTDLITEAIAELGGRKIDRFDIPTAGRAQPTDRACPRCRGTGWLPDDPTADPDEWRAHDGSFSGCPDCHVDGECGGRGRIPIVQRTSRGKHSTLLVFERPKSAR